MLKPSVCGDGGGRGGGLQGEHRQEVRLAVPSKQESRGPRCPLSWGVREELCRRGWEGCWASFPGPAVETAEAQM